MTKHEAPPFRMVIERGKLVPATPYDAERLDTYRSGMEVRVRFTEEKDRVMVRKWWAIIGRAVKECKTPWKTREEASEAIKLALGIVNLSKTVGGTWMQYPKSLTELDDPELTQAVEQMIDIIYHVTGVDASEWRKHVAHMKDEDSPAAPSTADDKAAEVDHDPDPRTSAADNTASSDAADQAGGDEFPPVSEPPASLSDDDRAWLKTIAKMLWAATGVGEQELLASTFKGARENQTPEAVSKAARDRGTSIYQKCKLVCFGEKDTAEALVEVAMTACVDPKELLS